MSNEMKDWLRDQKEEEDDLIEFIKECSPLQQLLFDIEVFWNDREGETFFTAMEITRYWKAGLPSRDTKWHKCRGTIKQYPKFLCSNCPPEEDIIDFNPIERMEELEKDSKFLYTLEAMGVNSWVWYDDSVTACNLMEDSV